MGQNFSIGANASTQKFGENALMSGRVTVGAEKNGYHANLFGGAGENGLVTGGAKIGHEWNWGNFGLDLSANAQSSKANDNVTYKYYKDVTIEHSFSVNADEPSTDVSSVVSLTETEAKGEEVRATNIRAGASLMGTYQPTSRVKFGLGVEGGVDKTTLAPKVVQDLTIDVTTATNADFDNGDYLNDLDVKVTSNYEQINNTTTKPYVNGVASAQVELGKNNQVQIGGNIKVTPNMKVQEATVGVAYKF